MSIDPKERQRVTDRNERIAEKQLHRVLGFEFEPLDMAGRQRRKRVEGALKESGGQPVALVEVKTLISGGVDPEDGAHFSTLDPSLPTTFDPEDSERNVRVRVRPVSAGNLEQHLAKAVDQYRQTIEDYPGYKGLPFVVVLFADPFGPALELIDRRIPGHPEISGLMYLVRNRLRNASLSEETLEEIEARLNGLGDAGLPPPDYEWRYVANPHAASPVPRDFVERCIEGWPEDPLDPERLDRSTRQAMLDTMQRLVPEQQALVRQLFRDGGAAELHIEVDSRFQSSIEALIDSGLLQRRGARGVEWTLRGRTVAAVDAA